MAIRFVCPNGMCGKKLTVSDDAAGRAGKCPGCGTKIVVPTLEAAGPIPVAPAPAYGQAPREKPRSVNIPPLPPQYMTPLPNPYQAPQVPAYPGPAYGPSEPFGGRPCVRFDAIGRAWSLYCNEAGHWLLALIVCSLVIPVFSVAMWIAIGTLGLMMVAVVGFPGVILAILLGVFCGSAFTNLIVAGLARMAIAQVDGRRASIGEIFTIDETFWPSLVSLNLFFLIAGVASFFFFLPGLVVSGVLMFALPLAIDGKRTGLQAIGDSWDMLSRDWLTATLFFLVLSIITHLGGMLLLGIGYLVTFPLFLLSIAVVYRDHYPIKGRGKGMSGFADEWPEAPHPRSWASA